MDNLAQTGEQLAQTGERLAESAAIVEVSAGLLLLVIAILLHGVGVRIVVRMFNRHWSRVTSQTPIWRTNLIIAGAVGSLASTHLAETLIFALPLYWHGLFENLRDAYFYVLESYTTLGEDNVALPDEWRLLGPIIAMAGLFTFGWTGSVLVSIMAQVGHIDRQQARAAEDADKSAGAPGG